MSKSDRLQQKSICGEPPCSGPSCQLCQALRESTVIHESIECPQKIPSCSASDPCDMCKATANSRVETRGGGAVGGGNVRSDMVPLQPVHGSSNQEKCDECRKPIGSNTHSCAFCASFAESKLNPEQPNIGYNNHFGPAEGSFGPYTDERIKRLQEDLKTMFEVAQQRNGLKFPINGKKVTPSRIIQLLSQNCVLGIEGMNNSCFGVVALWILSQGNAHTRIRTNCFAGYILYKILWELMTRLFVGRDLVDAFRLSLEAYPNIKRIIQFGEMDDPILLLSLLEEVGILTKGPIFSENECSFNLNEYKLEGRPPASSIQDAMLYSYTQNSHGSPVPENGSILSFKLCQQRPNQPFTKQILGTNFEFPHNGVILTGKLLRSKMFIIYDWQHYLVVLCVGEAFFLSNSLSASQCGHFLPETREISEEEAMMLFRTQAHTIVFECVGDVPPPPVSCAQCVWFPPPPPPAPSAQSAQAHEQKVIVWFDTAYRQYDPEQKVLRSTITGRIIDDIRAGTYRVEEKGTHKMIDIELREVPSDDALPPPAPREKVFSQIQLADITIRDGEWSIRRDSFYQSGTCVVSLNQYTFGNISYDQNALLTLLNILYRNHV